MYDGTHKKPEIQNFPTFFQIHTRRLTESFQGLNSLLAQSTCGIVKWHENTGFTDKPTWQRRC